MAEGSIGAVGGEEATTKNEENVATITVQFRHILTKKKNKNLTKDYEKVQ